MIIDILKKIEKVHPKCTRFGFQKGSKTWFFLCCLPSGLAKRPRDAPRRPQDRPRIPQDAPKRPPNAPRPAQDPQDALKTPQDAAKTPPGRPRRPQGRPRGPKVRPIIPKRVQNAKQMLLEKSRNIDFDVSRLSECFRTKILQIPYQTWMGFPM